MPGSIVPETLIDVFQITRLSTLCLTSALMLLTTQARAQHLDPPLGWDIWDPTWSTREVWKSVDKDETLRWRKERHQIYIDQGVPKAYRDASNPLARIPSVLEAGRELYVENCASCHDAGGQGRGEAGLSLFPPPALLIHLIRLPSRVDEYLIWSIAEGGEPFASGMPAFKDTLDTEQIWQIVTYMRAGFPGIGGEASK